MDYRIAAVQLLVFLFAITIHETSHALTADRLGDPTARRLGRISLNPLAHIDIFGTIIFPIMLFLMHWPVFGWAKPVPVNVHNLRRPKQHYMLVAAAGPASNLVLAALAAGAFYLLRVFASAVPSVLLEPLAVLIGSTIIVNTYLAVFNMIPIHPLDGAGVLAGLLPDDLSVKFLEFQRYGFLVLFAAIYLGVLDHVLDPVAGTLLTLFGVR